MTTIEEPPAKLEKSAARNEKQQHVLELLTVHRVLSTNQLAESIRGLRNPLAGMSYILREMEKQCLVRQVAKRTGNAGGGTWSLREYSKP